MTEAAARPPTATTPHSYPPVARTTAYTAKIAAIVAAASTAKHSGISVRQT